MGTITTQNASALVDKLIGSAYPVVKSVAQNLDAIKRINFKLNDIDTLLANLPVITTVASSIDNVNYTGDNIESIIEINANLADILAAASVSLAARDATLVAAAEAAADALSASDSESNASSSASVSTTQAGISTTQADISATQAGIATTKAGEAAASALAAAASASIFDVSNLTKTWNNAGTIFSAIKMNVTDTASHASSLLMDLQVGGSSRISFTKAGGASFANDVVINNSNGLHINSNAGYILFGLAPDIAITRDAAGVLAQRNGTNPQVLRVYNTYTDLSNYTRLALKTASGTHTIETESAGTGEANINLALIPKGTGKVVVGGLGMTVGGSGTNQNYFTVNAGGGGSGPTSDFIIQDFTTPSRRFIVTHSGNDFTFAAENAGSNGFRLRGSSTKLMLMSDGANIIEFAPGSNTIEHRNGTNAQSFRVYKSYTNDSNFERFSITSSAFSYDLVGEALGTGSQRNIRIGTNASAPYVSIFTNATERLMITGTGMIAIGQNTSDYPALKRSAAVLEVKLGDDSAYAQTNMLALALVDGMAAPAATVGLAKIYVDSADGDLKIIFGDGTVKTIMIDT